jgi:hypothetical protein
MIWARLFRRRGRVPHSSQPEAPLSAAEAAKRIWALGTLPEDTRRILVADMLAVHEPNPFHPESAVWDLDFLDANLRMRIVDRIRQERGDR